MKAVFLRALEAEDKGAAILAAIREPEPAGQRQRFEPELSAFAALPRSPFAYWVSDRLSRLFTELPPFESGNRTARVGIQTADDKRFMRLAWEVSSESISDTWVLLAKGGAFSPFYTDVHRVVKWRSSGEEIRVIDRARVQNAGYYFMPGITWPLRGIRFSAQAVPAGCAFDVAGKMAFISGESPLPWLALFNSSAFNYLLCLFAGKVGGVQYQAGLIRDMPVPQMTEKQRDVLAKLARRAWSLKRMLDSRVENSHAFVLPATLLARSGDFGASMKAWNARVRAITEELGSSQEELNDRCFEIYEIDEGDRRVIAEGFNSDDGSIGDVLDPNGEREDDEDEEVASNDYQLAAELVSWAVGVSFGRFDVQLATGERELPAEPEPFDRLPVCAPGMLTGEDGAPCTSIRQGYPISCARSGVLIDDLGHGEDVEAGVESVFAVVFGARAESWMNEVSNLLRPTGHELRDWLRSDFFDFHLKLYSNSGRKAPIYWQLATPSLGYSVWLYAHRLTRDSFFQIQNDVVAPKLAHEERKLASLVQGTGGSPSAKERKEIAAQESFVEELRAMLEEVKRVAPLWNPNLHDGGVLTMAPLWRLVPQHKSWQKELRSRWDELCAGKYDWAHVAMHLWPERVVPQCAKDRSLAIAHELEDVFWVEGDDGKWTARPEPTQPVDELVKERTSSAVKAALASLLEAPVPGASGRGRRKGSRAASAKGNR